MNNNENENYTYKEFMELSEKILMLNEKEFNEVIHRFYQERNQRCD